MAKKSPGDAALGRASRKRRTREHILQDLSVQHVARMVVRCGFTLQRVEADYGLDVWMQTYTPEGEIEDDLIWMQLKAAESLRQYERKGEAVFSFPADTRDVRLWAQSLLPVYLVLYDARMDEAYWINVKEEIGDRPITGKQVRLRVPGSNVLGAQTIRLMQEHKNALVRGG